MLIVQVSARGIQTRTHKSTATPNSMNRVRLKLNIQWFMYINASSIQCCGLFKSSSETSVSTQCGDVQILFILSSGNP